MKNVIFVVSLMLLGTSAFASQGKQLLNCEGSFYYKTHGAQPPLISIQLKVVVQPQGIVAQVFQSSQVLRFAPIIKTVKPFISEHGQLYVGDNIRVFVPSNQLGDLPMTQYRATLTDINVDV